MSTVDKCALAVTFAEDMWLCGAHVVQLIFALSVLVLACFCFLKKQSRRVAVHANLKVILANTVMLYILVSASLVFMLVRYEFVLYRFYHDPCDLLSPSWVSIVVRAPYFVYFVAFPLWHLTISMERSWATFRVHDYEEASSLYGIVCSAFVWTASIGYVSYLVSLALQDPTFQDQTVCVSLTTNTTAQMLLDTHYYLLALDVLTSLVDIGLVFWNKKIMRKATDRYSLSDSYQVHENVVVTLRLVLHLSICNTAVFVVFIALSTWGRTLRASLQPHSFYALYEWIFVVQVLQLVVPLLILVRFTKKAKKTAVIHPQSEHKDLYFEYFRKQIGAT